MFFYFPFKQQLRTINTKGRSKTINWNTNIETDYTPTVPSKIPPPMLKPERTGKTGGKLSMVFQSPFDTGGPENVDGYRIQQLSEYGKNKLVEIHLDPQNSIVMSREQGYTFDGSCKYDKVDELTSVVTTTVVNHMNENDCDYDGYVVYSEGLTKGITVTQLLAKTEYYFRAAAVLDSQAPLTE